MQKFLLPLFLLFSTPVLAQALDASIPDASVDTGGSERASEENDPNGPCLDSRSCDNGTVCQGGRCVPTAPRNATGCGAVSLLAVLPLGLLRRSSRA
jgi:hypothetical protein